MPRMHRVVVLVLVYLAHPVIASSQTPAPLTLTATTHTSERGRLFVFRRQNIIGTERYEVERWSDSVVLRATHGYSDRNFQPAR